MMVMMMVMKMVMMMMTLFYLVPTTSTERAKGIMKIPVAPMAVTSLRGEIRPQLGETNFTLGPNPELFFLALTGAHIAIVCHYISAGNFLNFEEF